jgi:predicted Ser/Thr protein kinase
LALALPACGSRSSAAPEPSTAKTMRSAGAEPPSGSRPAATSASCASHLSGFVDQLEHLRRSLVIGVSYEQYVAELGTVRESYEQVPVGKLDLACVAGAAESAEESFDGYLAAANAWGDCVSKAGCETTELEPKLQRRWRAAAKQLAAAKQALAAG